jgi:hypothetical protein
LVQRQAGALHRFGKSSSFQAEQSRDVIGLHRIE